MQNAQKKGRAMQVWSADVVVSGQVFNLKEAEGRKITVNGCAGEADK